MRRINRKIKRGTLGHATDPTVIAYNNKYNIGTGLCFRVLTLFGDSKYSHEFCEFLAEKQKTEKTSGISFEKLIEEFEGNDGKPIIESKLNLD